MSRLICAANIFTLGSTCSPCRTATTTTISPLFFLHERPYKPEALHVPTIFFLILHKDTNDYANSVSAARGWLVGIPESGWLPVQNCSQDNSWDTAYAVELNIPQSTALACKSLGFITRSFCSTQRRTLSFFEVPTYALHADCLPASDAAQDASEPIWLAFLFSALSRLSGNLRRLRSPSASCLP